MEEHAPAAPSRGAAAATRTPSWSISVVAVAVSAPRAAASARAELVWRDAPGTVGACSGPYVGTVEAFDEDGAGVAGASVAVRPPGGLTWCDGTTGARVFVTGADGSAEPTEVTTSSWPARPGARRRAGAPWGRPRPQR